MGAIIGGRGRGLRPPWSQLRFRFLHRPGGLRFLPGMTSASVRADIERSLDAIQRRTRLPLRDRNAADPKHRVFTVVMEPFDLPKDEYILDAVLRQYRAVTGREPDGVGTVLPGSYTGDDTCHLWAAGVPCLLYGPGGGSESETIPTSTAASATWSRWPEC